MTENEFKQLQTQIAVLQNRIDTQELSSDDLDRMTKERSRLQEMLQAAEMRFKDVQSLHWQKETCIAQQMDKVLCMICICSNFLILTIMIRIAN